MDLTFSSFDKNLVDEFNSWQVKEKELGIKGFEDFVVLKGATLGDYLDFISREIKDIDVECISVGNVLVGFVGYSFQDEDHIHVEILGVNPDLRGQGISGNMLKEFKKRKQEELNVKRFTLSVRKNNSSGIDSFSKVGKKSKMQDKENYINYEL